MLSRAGDSLTYTCIFLCSVPCSREVGGYRWICAFSMRHDLLSKHRNFPGWRHTSATRTWAIDKLRRHVCVCQWTYSTVVRLFAENRRTSPHDVCRKLCHLSTVTRLWDGWPNIRGLIPCRVKTDISFSQLSDRLWEQSSILIPT